jgi:endonuclease YncB( thermonuclease family)
MTPPPYRRIPGLRFDMEWGVRSWIGPRGGLSILAVLFGLALGAMPVRASERAAPCAAAATDRDTVTAVVDERTLRLAGGRELRLAGLETILDAGDATTAETAAQRAKAELERLALGKAIAVRILGEDRYGRSLALAVPAAEPAGQTIQERLISGGFGIAAARNGGSGCHLRFLEVERGARAAHLGLWADPHYLIHEAERLGDLRGIRGRFALVQGRVVSVNDRGAIVYVNFGRRWSEDFTVTIVKRNKRNFAATGLDPKTLTGRQIRVRGWVGERGGPWIEAFGPEQIEVVN